MSCLSLHVETVDHYIEYRQALVQIKQQMHLRQLDILANQLTSIGYLCILETHKRAGNCIAV